MASEKKKVNMASVRSAMATAGLDDPQVLLNCCFESVEEFLGMLLPMGMETEFADGVVEQVRALLGRVGEDAELRRRTTRLDVTGGLEDALYAAKKHKAQREAEDLADRPAAIRYLSRSLKFGETRGGARSA
jgi:hypothetical protein